MTDALRTVEDYELFLCTLTDDPQPHPNEPALQSTHPHHKHVPPEMKHNRVPAPGMSFTRPNLPMLIGEIERLLEERQSQPLGSE